MLPGLTVDSITSRVSRVRNPVIARFFREMGYIEQWGTGLPGVIRKLRERDLPAPGFEERPGQLLVTIPIPVHRPSVEPHPEGQRLTVNQVSNQVEGLGSRSTALLLTIRDQPATWEKLLNSIGRANQTRSVGKYLQPLLDAGLLELTQPRSPNSPTQRYRITDKGAAALRQAEQQ